jgi:hypothetical protein
MWMIVTRAAALIGLGLGAGSMMSSSSKGTSHHVPPAVIQEASSSISPFLIVAIALLVLASGYFVHSIRKNR